MSTKERMTKIETQIEYIAAKLDKLDNNMSLFIDSSNSKFAAQKLVTDLEKRLMKQELITARWGGSIAVLLLLLQILSWLV